MVDRSVANASVPPHDVGLLKGLSHVAFLFCHWARAQLQPEAAPQRQVEVATKVATQWADEEPETEVDSGGGDGRGDGRRGLRRQY